MNRRVLYFFSLKFGREKSSYNWFLLMNNQHFYSNQQTEKLIHGLCLKSLCSTICVAQVSPVLIHFTQTKRIYLYIRRKLRLVGVRKRWRTLLFWTTINFVREQLGYFWLLAQGQLYYSGQKWAFGGKLKHVDFIFKSIYH